MKNVLASRQQLIKEFEARAFKKKSKCSPVATVTPSLIYLLEKFCLNCNTPVRSLRADSHAKLFYSQGVSNKQIKAYQERMSAMR